jgi:hypothetical protein
MARMMIASTHSCTNKETSGEEQDQYNGALKLAEEYFDEVLFFLEALDRFFRR